MIDHISVAVRDLDTSARFYERLLEPLGLKRLVVRDGTVGFGKRYPEFWINARPLMSDIDKDTGVHICLRAPTKDAVKDFHSAALAAGGSDDGPPGDRQATMTVYFAAFIKDLDGNKIEAASFPRKE